MHAAADALPSAYSRTSASSSNTPSRLDRHRHPAAAQAPARPRHLVRGRTLCVKVQTNINTRTVVERVLRHAARQDHLATQKRGTAAAYPHPRALDKRIESLACSASHCEQRTPHRAALMSSAAPAPPDYDQQWHAHWHEGVDPGSKWDAGCCSPLLAHLLTTRQLDVSAKRVLVPGCGRAYDVFAFAAAGAALAVGLDLCEAAVAAAAAERDSHTPPPQLLQLQQQQPGANSGGDGGDWRRAAELAPADFFKFSHDDGRPFELGYDYTFLCALHPDMRSAWAAAWARLLAPGGELVTLVFPVGEGGRPGGPANPPWQVTPELYRQLLLPAGFEQVVLEPVPAELSHPGRAGREWLGRWRRLGSGAAADGAVAAAAAGAGSAASRM